MKKVAVNQQPFVGAGLGRPNLRAAKARPYIVDERFKDSELLIQFPLS